ncbi:hypothetical protein RB195_020727 [Necator americanus]|uniref:Uncharacterized protein n=1 Tax=Necator americanus TaxID=51031 RepID=A0ABR1CMY7_NECAM
MERRGLTTDDSESVTVVWVNTVESEEMAKLKPDISKDLESEAALMYFQQIPDIKKHQPNSSGAVMPSRTDNMENVTNDLKEELNRRMRAAWAAFAAIREAKDQLTDQNLRAHPFDSTVLPALCYAAETWADTAATSRKLLTTHRALERCLLKFNRRTQHLAGLRSSDLRGMSRLRDPAEYVSKAKHRWAGHIMRRIDDRWTNRTLEWIPRDAKRPRGRPPT